VVKNIVLRRNRFLSLIFLITGIMMSILSFGISAKDISNINALFPNEKEKDNIVLKRVDYKEQEISYFIYMPSRNKMLKDKESVSNKTMYFIFHGETTSAENFLNKTDLHTKIINNNNSFIAFNSTANDWFSHEKKNFKDESFILNLIRIVQKRKNDGIYGYKNYKIIAYSSGASLVNKFICEGTLSNIDSYALVNGSGKEDWLNNCNNLSKQNIKIINSEEDDYYTYDNKEKKNQRYKTPESDFMTLSSYQNKLRIKLNCEDNPIESMIDNSMEDSSSVSLYSYSCKNKSNLDIYTLHYAGHNFPSAINFGLEDFRGTINKDINVYDILNE